MNRDEPRDSVWNELRSYGDDDNCPCGLLVGYYALESLLQSTLKCLDNVTCIGQLKSMYNRSDVSCSSLDPTLTLHVPLHCAYTLNQRTALIYTVTSSFGLFEGLSVAVKLLVLISVKIAKHIKVHCCWHRTTTVAIATE